MAKHYLLTHRSSIDFFLLPLKVSVSYFKIQIFMFLKLESESAMQKNPK